MNTLQKRILSALAAILLIGVAAYWYWSPYLAVHALRKAAEAADAERFNAHVDFPRLRESLKSQFAARLSGDQGEQAGNGFGRMLAGALVDKLIDTAVRPESVMFAMREGRFKIAKHGTREGGQGKGEGEKLVWTTERPGVDTIIFHAEDDGSARTERMALVMQRQGFADWKLTDIQLPQ